MTARNRQDQSGNVIFFILIAIALLAALAFSITRSSRSGGNISQKDTVFSANAVMGAGDALRAAAGALAANGVSISDISFQRAAADGYEHTPETSTHKIFHNDGAGLSYPAPDALWLDAGFSAKGLYGDWIFPANICLNGVGTGRAGCESDASGATEEIVALLPYVKREVCIQVNNRLDIGLCGGEPCVIDTDLDGWTPVKYQGLSTFADGIVIDDSTNQFTGKPEGCIQANDDSSGDFDGSYIYYKVLVAR